MNGYIHGFICEDEGFDGNFNIRFRAILDYKKHELAPLTWIILQSSM